MIEKGDVRYNVGIIDLEYMFDSENNRKTVFAIHWECKGTYTKNGIEYLSSRNGKTSISVCATDYEKFIPYEDLSKRYCLSLLAQNQNFEQVQNVIAMSIAQQIYGTTLNGVPWEK